MAARKRKQVPAEQAGIEFAPPAPVAQAAPTVPDFLAQVGPIGVRTRTGSVGFRQGKPGHFCESYIDLENAKALLGALADAIMTIERQTT